MYVLKYDTDAVSCKLEYTNQSPVGLPANGLLQNKDLTTFWANVLALHAAVPLTELRVKLTDPQTYDYKITGQDGRVFHQVLTFDVPTDPRQTFDVATPWRLSEFILHRPIREYVTTLYAKYGLQDLKITFS